MKYFRDMMSDEKSGVSPGSLSRFMKMGTFLVWVPLIVLEACGVGEVAVPLSLSALLGTMVGAKAIKDTFKKPK